jgi:hypothetical protein
MVSISITAEAYEAITGRLPDPSKRDDRGGYALVIDRKTIDQLTAVRGPGESFSDVIIRLAKGDGGEE